MNLIINFISSKNSATTAEIANYVGLGVSRVHDYLRELKENGTIVAEGSFKDRRYKIIETNKENKK